VRGARPSPSVPSGPAARPASRAPRHSPRPVPLAARRLLLTLLLRRPGVRTATCLRNPGENGPDESCTLPRLRLSLSLSRSSSESSGSDEEPVEESDEVERRRGCCRCDEPTAGSRPPSDSGGRGLAGGTSGSSAVTVSCGITGTGGARGSPLGTCAPRRLAPRARGSPAAAAAATAAQRASKSRRSSPTLRRGALSSPGLQGPTPLGRAMLAGPPGRV
ncbi:hypothetical protein MC885_002509, partial [Smutsia gigantea]